MKTMHIISISNYINYKIDCKRLG